MLQAQKNYVHGTAAEKLPSYDVYEENVVLKDKKKAKVNSKIKQKAVLYVMIAFAMCLVVIVRYAMITELSYSINKEYKRYNEIRNENSRLKIAIEKEVDLNTIKEIAEKNLGMQKPDKFQVVYLRVAKGDYTEVGDTGAQDGKAADRSFAVLKEKISGMLRFLY